MATYIKITYNNFKVRKKWKLKNNYNFGLWKGNELKMEKILEVKNIEKYYGNKSNLTKAIDNISFNVQKGEFVGIMGASGSRKNNTIKLYFNNRQSYSRENNS